MSTEESVGIQAKKNFSVGRGRGKTSNQQTATSQSKNNTSESKSESWSKTVVENSLPKRVPRGRGWRRPDQARYVPRALRKENNKEIANSQSSKDPREEDKTHKNNRDILSDSDNNGQTCADRQLATRLHPEEENSAVSIASDKVQEFPRVSNEKSTEELVMSCEQYKSLDVRKELVDISDIKEDSCFEKDITGNEKFDSKQIKEPIDPQGGKELQVSVLTEVLEMKNSMTSENDTCVKSFQLAENIEEKQYLFRNQDKMGTDKSANSVEQIKVNDACLSIADNSVQGNKQRNLMKNTLGEIVDSVDHTQMTDICQSKSLVISCIESDNEQEGQNLFHQDVKESVSLDHQYQQPLIDTCQSSSTDGVDKCDDDTQHKELRSIEYPDLRENSLMSDKDFEVTNTLEPKDGKSKLLENTSIVDENLDKENRQLPMLENQGVMGSHLGNISEKTQFTETCQLPKCYTEVNSELHDASGCCSVDVTSMASSRGDNTLEVESCQSSKCYIEINSELHDANGCCSGDITSMTSSREDEPLEVDSKADEAYDEVHLVKESSSNCVLDKISKEVEDDGSCATLRDDAELIHEREKTDNCCKSDVASVEKTCTGDKANFEAKDGIVKNEIVNEIPDENEEVQRKNTETERGTSKEYRTLETVNCNDNKNMNSDGLVNNEKTPETEAKQKKKSKKKKDREAEARDEKKKKKRKKKESEGDGEESKEKDKEKDEKNSKLKKKSKKKATKEDSESKSEDSKSKEKLKDKKEKKCKNGSEDDADDDDDESWESKFNEDGDCLEPELLNELTEVTGIKKPSKHKTQFDYYALPSKEVTLDDDDDSGYGHVVELYDFSPELKTQDLVQLLSSFKSQGYDIKWVDDTHALAVFSSEIAAKQAIQTCSSPILKLRPVSQGTSESKSKAKKCCSFLQPYKPRPKTTNLAAHRLVTGALGVRSTMSKEDREREREKIKEAKEQKRQEKQRKAEIWGE